MTGKRLKTNVDSLDMFLLLVGGAIYAAFSSWAKLIVRAIRGEEAKEDWRLVVSTAAAMSAFVVLTGSSVRGAAALRETVVEMRTLVREGAEDAQRRDERAAKQQAGLTTLTKWLVGLAVLTLAAAIVAVAS